MSKEKKTKKKKKTVYIDDGSTIIDMSGVSDARPRAFGSRPASKKNFGDGINTQNGGEMYTGNKFKDSFRTYFRAVKMMLIPMFVVIGIIAIAFLILWILMTIAS